MTTMREIGEFGLIERLAAQVDAAELKGPEYEGFALRYGIGDDAAAWRLEGGIEVATTDTVVEGSHFTRETTPWNDLGWKAWAANVSDVASMGALPLTGVVTLGLPADLPVRYIEELYEGMLDGCHEYGTLIVGGDVVSSRDVFVSVTMNGVCIGEPLVRCFKAATEARCEVGVERSECRPHPLRVRTTDPAHRAVARRVWLGR